MYQVVSVIGRNQQAIIYSDLRIFTMSYSAVVSHSHLDTDGALTALFHLTDLIDILPDTLH